MVVNTQEYGFYSFEVRRKAWFLFIFFELKTKPCFFDKPIIPSLSQVQWRTVNQLTLYGSRC